MLHTPRTPRRLSLAVLVVALACARAEDAPNAADSAADSAAASAGAPAAPTAPTLVVGNRYETQGGSVVCPNPDALRRLVDVARGGDAAAFAQTIERERCSPVVAGAVVTIAEQRDAAARVRRAGDTATYWMLAEKLTPR